MVYWELRCKTSNPCGVLCCAAWVLSLNETAMKGKLILKKKITSLHQLGDIKLKGQRDIKLKFFQLVRNGEKVRGFGVSLFRCFCGRSKVEWSWVWLFNSTGICGQSTYSCFNSQLLPFAEHCKPATPWQLLHVSNFFTRPGVVFRNARSSIYVNTMNGRIEWLPYSGLGC